MTIFQTDHGVTASVVSAPVVVGLEAAIERARGSLLKKQFKEGESHLDRTGGFWCGELQGDSILESEYILIRWILGQEGDPKLVAIANYLRKIQQQNGGWNMYPGGAPDISGTVKAYFALKLMGDSPNAPHMARARELILKMGGAEKCNTFTRFYFAALGQISYDACPSIPPEVVLLPKWFYFNLLNVSAWTRTMILPLGIVTTTQFTREKALTAEQRIDELYLDWEAANRLAQGPREKGIFPKTWTEFFLRVDSALKRYNQRPVAALRNKSMKLAQEWIIERSDNSEGLGAIFPPMVYMLVVYRIWGYPEDHPRVVKAHKELEDFFITETVGGKQYTRIQPCLSPVWDTGITLHALAETGISSEDPQIRHAVKWLLSKEVTFASDWKIKCPEAPVGGWYFEFSNPHYPDTDDTAMAALSLRRLGGEVAKAAVERGTKWVLAMQNEDGGWAAFDKTTPRPILEYIPFADHNAMQDPSCPDITGRNLESLGYQGYSVQHQNVRKAIEYLKSQQDADGSWWGRWGVNYIYGTWQVLCGLKAVGEDMSQPYVQKAVGWLKSVQKPDGSFGETCDSYIDKNLKNTGTATASQTAWGTMGLLAACGAEDPAVVKGIHWLVKTQAAHGGWDEEPFTGTGFPKVFYLKYHLYRHYFPLMALGRYRRLKGG